MAQYPGGYRPIRPQGPQSAPSYSNAVSIPKSGKMQVHPHHPHRLAHNQGAVAAASPPNQGVVMNNVIFQQQSPVNQIVSPAWMAHPQQFSTNMMLRPTTPPTHGQHPGPFIPPMMPGTFVSGGQVIPQGAAARFQYPQHPRSGHPMVHGQPGPGALAQHPHAQQHMQQRQGQSAGSAAPAAQANSAPRTPAQPAQTSAPTSNDSNSSASRSSTRSRRTSNVKIVNPNTGEDLTETLLHNNSKAPNQPHTRVNYAAAAQGGAASPAGSAPTTSASSVPVSPGQQRPTSKSGGEKEKSEASQPATESKSEASQSATEGKSDATPVDSPTATTAAPKEDIAQEAPKTSSEPPSTDPDASGETVSEPAAVPIESASSPAPEAEASVAKSDEPATQPAATTTTDSGASQSPSDSASGKRTPPPVTTGAATAESITFEERKSPASPTESPQLNVRAAKSKSAKDFRNRELPDSDPLDVYRDRPTKEKSKSAESKKPAESKKSTESKKAKAQSPVPEPTWDEKDEKELVADLPQKPAATEESAKAASSTKEDAEKVKPEASSVKPEASSVKPEASAVKPEASGVKYDNPEQWRPENPDGKKSYSRDFLKQFRTIARKPDNLPRLDIIKAQPIHSAGGHRSPADGSGTFLPNFISNMPSGGRGSTGNRGSRGSRSSTSGQSGRKTVVLQMDSIVEPLKKSENRWTGNREKKTTDNAEEAKKQLLGKVRTILNKLTPEKFEKLTNDIVALPIKTEDELIGTVELVFNKAICEKIFSENYARMCSLISTLKVKNSAGDPVTFRKLLLTMCQKEFEATKDSAMKELKDKFLSGIEKMTPEEQKAKKSDYEMEVKWAKRRSLGNMRFIGELFKLGLLTENIMHECIVKLLQAADEESLELMVSLMSTTGRKLDHEKAHGRINQYFEKIDRTINKGQVTSRIRFMLLDLVEQKRNNWIGRNNSACPKKIDEVHHDAQMEAFQAKEAAAAAPPPGRNSSHRGDRNLARGGRGSHGSRTNAASDDGWQTAPSRQRADPEKINRASQRALSSRTDDTVSLGPSGRSAWGQGSSMGATASSQPRDVERGGNRYASLAMSDPLRSPDQRVNGATFGPPPRRAGSQGVTSPPSSRPGGRPGRGPSAMDAQKDRANALKSVSASLQSRPPLDRSVSAPGPTSNGAQGSGMPESQVQSKTLSLTDEFLGIHDKKEAVLCIRDLKSPEHFPLVVCSMVSRVVEKKEAHCLEIADLLCYIIANKVIPVEKVAEGCVRVFEDAPDLAFDIPRVYDLIAVTMAPVVIECDLSLSVVSDGCVQHLRDAGRAATMMGKLLSAIAKEKGEEYVQHLWQTARLSWSALVSEGRSIDEFLQDNKLQYTVAVTMRHLVTTKASSKDVCAWIDEKYKACNTPALIEELVTSIAKAHIKAPESSADHRYVVHGDELTHFLEDSVFKYFEDAELQYAALLALEKVSASYEHPPAMLQSLFDSFYSGSNIELDTYFKWEKMASASDLHGVALNSVKQFLQFLHTEAAAPNE